MAGRFLHYIGTSEYKLLFIL